MNIQLADFRFDKVSIPVLWGDRAIVKDRNGALSVIALDTPMPRLEIVQDQPAPGVRFRVTWSGFQILGGLGNHYDFHVDEKLFTSESLGLPEVQIYDMSVRVGDEIYPNYSDYLDLRIGIQVNPNEVLFRVPLPYSLFQIIDRKAAVS